MQRTLNDFWAVVASKATHPAYRSHRYGQIVSNTLYAFNQSLSLDLAGSALDPFMFTLEELAEPSSTFVAFCTYLEDNWNV